MGFYFAPQIVHVENARGGQHRFEIFEDMDKIVRDREPHKVASLDQLFFLKKVKAVEWGSAQYMGRVVVSVLP